MTMRKPRRKPYAAPIPPGPMHARPHKLIRRWVTPSGLKAGSPRAVAPAQLDRWCRFKGRGPRNWVF